MQFTATAFRYLSYLGLVSGLGLAFWHLRYGAAAFLFSIACAHIAQVIRSDKHAEDMQETLSVLLQLAARSAEKMGISAPSGASSQQRPPD